MEKLEGTKGILAFWALVYLVSLILFSKPMAKKLMLAYLVLATLGPVMFVTLFYLQTFII